MRGERKDENKTGAQLITENTDARDDVRAVWRLRVSCSVLATKRVPVTIVRLDRYAVVTTVRPHCSRLIDYTAYYTRRLRFCNRYYLRQAGNVITCACLLAGLPKVKVTRGQKVKILFYECPDQNCRRDSLQKNEN